MANRRTVSFQPKTSGIRKQSPSAVGITNVGRGHNLRLAWEMKELESRNIACELTRGKLQSVPFGADEGGFTTLVCQSRHRPIMALTKAKAIPVPFLKLEKRGV